MFAESVHCAGAVVDKLVERFGVQRLGLVEQLGEHSFRARLSGGGYAMAGVDTRGSVWIKLSEEES